ncbi:tRNA lysidine(34) synthetase TilS [bacterium]|nr:tRNA lysidine(34) synthetase TilS [bacterium]
MIQNAKKRILSLQGKVLLGLSGGPDSMCLYHLLQECRKDFVVAHVDHGLREGSAEEKEVLARRAKEDGVLFYSITLKGHPSSNLEDKLRVQRISFFQKVLEEEGMDSLLLGHQKDERAETIIKRFFEGGSLTHLPAMKEESIYEGIKVVRPLLETTKKEVLAYLEKKGATYFVDPTNIGEGNLRARMRSSLIPRLEEAFGKNMTDSVCSRADQIAAMDAFVQREVDKLVGKEEHGIFGVFFPKRGIDPFLYLEWICRWAKREGIIVSRAQKVLVEKLLEKEEFGKKVELGKRNLFVEKEGVFVLEKDIVPLEGIWKEGATWRDVWKKGTEIAPVKPLAQPSCTRKKSSEWHRTQKTPICLRSLFPIKEI